MNANISRAFAIALPAALLVLASSCSDTRVVPTPTPTPAPAPLRPAPMPQVDWRAAPITPGDWTWGMIGGQSVATFAGGLLQLRCDRAAGTVVMARRGTAPAAVPVTVTTSATTRPLNASPNAAAGSLDVSLAARDPLLDAMAFSRGRFAVETSGLATLYVPSWPEVSRVIEDCR